MTIPQRWLLAWFVHLYTSLGVPLGVWAIFETFHGEYRRAWLLLAATVVLDATDGAMARYVRVWEVLPGVDGRRLDDIVDYFCWVIVPVVLLVQTGLLPAWAAAAPLLASCYGFAQVAAKTDDDYFLGFPSYWSLGAFYLYLFESPPWFNAALVLSFSVLVFVPVRYPYPTKTKPLRPLTLILGTLWGLSMMALLVLLPEKLGWLLWGSLFFPLYYLGLTVWLRVRRPR